MDQSHDSQSQSNCALINGQQHLGLLWSQLNSGIQEYGCWYYPRGPWLQVLSNINVSAAKNCTTPAIFFYFSCTSNHGISIELKRLLDILAVFSQLLIALSLMLYADCAGLYCLIKYPPVFQHLTAQFITPASYTTMRSRKVRQNVSHYGPGLWFTIKNNCTISDLPIVTDFCF